MRGKARDCNCRYRDGILCDGITCCEGCGWYPKEEKRRILELREARKPKQQFIRQSFVPGEHNQHWQRGGLR